MGGFYELVGIDCCQLHTYYYFYSPRTIKHPQDAIKSGYACDAMRLVINDREETLIKVTRINIVKYFYKKYIKNAGTFLLGYRVNWEREIKNL